MDTRSLVKIDNFFFRVFILEFFVNYNDKEKNFYIPFTDFIVELAGSSGEDFKVRTHLNQVYLNDCSDPSVSCIQNIPPGNYTVSVGI